MTEKKIWQDRLLSLLEPLLDRFSPLCAGIRLSGGGATYPQSVIELEAFARPLWGLVPFWIGGGHHADFEEKYARGLASGCDPDSSEYWGDAGDCDQRFVEMAPIAFGLMAVPEVLWTPLDERSRRNLALWLYQINDHELPKCNWYYFRILVNLALKHLGCAYSKEKLEEDFAFIDSCYLEDGWYRDGVSGRTDYYSAFAMQYYPLLLAFLGEGEKDKIWQRASQFASSFIYWFSDDGASIAYGRSLTYRFATSAFWSALVLSPAGTFDLAIAKGLIERNINYWLDKSIFDNAGILTVGFGYPNMTMAERYNAPGSPYWCLKSFLFLALSDDHPFWKTEAAPLPLLEDTVKLNGNMLVSNEGWNACLYTPGMLNMRSLGHFTEKYDKFVYSSAFPFSVSHSTESIEDAAPDSMLAFIVDGKVCVRKGSTSYEVSKDCAVSKWSPCSGIEVTTEIVPQRGGHLRIHKIESSIECLAYDCGFAMEKGERKLFSAAECVEGEGTETVLDMDPNTNLLWRNAVIPAVKYQIPRGKTVLKTRIRIWKEQ